MRQGLKTLSDECRIGHRMRNECLFLASVDIHRNCVTCPFDPLTWPSSLGNLRSFCVLFLSFVNVIRFSCVKRHSFLIRWPMPALVYHTSVPHKPTYDKRMPFLAFVDICCNLDFMLVWSFDWTLIIRYNLLCLYLLLFSFVNVVRFSCVKSPSMRHSCDRAVRP